MAMIPVVMEANPRVAADAGRYALCCGPLVYCLEAVDNGADLNDLKVDIDTLKMDWSESLGLPALVAEGSRCPACEALYRPVTAERIAQKVTFIPYFAFANRGESEMLVWFFKK